MFFNLWIPVHQYISKMYIYISKKKKYILHQ